MKYRTLAVAFVAASFSIFAKSQTVEADANRAFKDAGYSSLKQASFEDTKKMYAITAFYRADKTRDMFFANVDPKNGSLAFKVMEKCNSEHPPRVEERIIKISGQRITADFVCLGKGNDAQGIYLLKSADAQDFAKRQFLEKPYVLVQLVEVAVPVPFKTEGFSQAIEEASRKPL